MMYKKCINKYGGAFRGGFTTGDFDEEKFFAGGVLLVPICKWFGAKSKCNLCYLN